MKEYPSILSSNGQNFRDENFHTFDKIDGSNLRFEWMAKRGWYKFGTRTRLFDTSDDVFGEAIPLFMDSWSESLNKIARAQRWQNLIVYCEFWGEKSFAGIHEPADPKTLTLFDVAPDKRGLLGPAQYLKLFGDLNIATYLGTYHWTRGFITAVRNNEIPGITFEGIVGKTGEGHKLVMRKAKTQAWIDAVKSRYTESEASKIINS